MQILKDICWLNVLMATAEFCKKNYANPKKFTLEITHSRRNQVTGL